MQKFEKLMLFTTIISVIMLGWLFMESMFGKQQVELNAGITESSLKNYATKTGEMGAVMVEVTPINASKYSISLNTHSVELDFEFKDSFKLEDDKGNTYTPVSWSGGTGGHHLNGEILFSTVDSSAEILKLTITGIGEKTLTFDWSVQ